ncbi:IS3 family transposase [Polaribacter litorisediminis]|uniref:AbiH family protein n=1 Tax=Polaribacter litorisediminis TaxID=1908341 RepID=UPI001CBE4F7A|nr:AbiH family protein [Polaribacter litorisediminis]UAM97020.1 IS3 family transposase [Polaribacter litorisediminis]
MKNVAKVYNKLILIGNGFDLALGLKTSYNDFLFWLLKSEVLKRFDYQYFGEIEQILKRYVKFYNNRRLHGLLGRITPMEKWNADKHLIMMKKLTA